MSVANRLMWYAIIAAGQIIATTLTSLYVTKAGHVASTVLHSNMLKALLHAPLSFFHTNSIGSTMARLTTDTAEVDHSLPMHFARVLNNGFVLAANLVFISAETPYTMTVIVPVIGLLGFVFRRFQPLSIDLTRLTQVIFGGGLKQLNNMSTREGVASVRAYRLNEHVLSKFHVTVDDTFGSKVVGSVAFNWFFLRVEMIAVFLTGLVSVLAVQQIGESNDPSAQAKMGVVLTLVVSMTSTFNQFLLSAGNAERSLNAVERIGTYIDVAPEAPQHLDGDPVGDQAEPWPSRGLIEVKQMSLRYRKDTPLVLHNLSFEIQAGAKVGVVGRTGSGKTTLFKALFRLIECAEGSIVLDGIDTKSLGLHVLRSRMSILPQEPVLFKSSLRKNLDPFDQYEDAELWRALELSHLKDFVSSVSEMDLETEEHIHPKLEMQIHAHGANFSAGQKQLISLTRALLSRAKMMVLDEVTANCDLDTDRKVQQTIRAEFDQTTMLVIAHRPVTIIDMDKILVLDKGHQVEYDAPATLLANKDGHFAKIVEDTGPAMAQRLRKIASKEISLFDE